MPAYALNRLPLVALLGAALLVATPPHLRAQDSQPTLDAAAACALGRAYRAQGTIRSRLQSQRVLEAARARYPDDLDVLFELSATYFAQSFYPDAVRGLRAVLEHDPSRCDARALLGLYHYKNWQRMNEFIDDLADARRELRAVAKCQPQAADVALRALVAGYALGDSIRAECDELVARFPQRPEFRFMRGTLAFEAKRYEACARDYADALALTNDSTRAVYGGLTHVLGAHDDARYRDATAAVQEDFQRGLWLVDDPDPTTEVNPRALEHTYRLFVADCLYGNEPTKRRGWQTDRGEAFVRFGHPIDIDYTMGEGFINGKVETWSFVTDGVFHQIAFVDEFLNGNPRIPSGADLTLHFMRHWPASSTLEPDALDIPAFVDAYAFRDDDMTGSVYLAMAVDAAALRTTIDERHQFVLRGAYFDEVWAREGGFTESVPAAQVVATPERVFEFVRRLRVPCDRYHLAMAFEDRKARVRAVGRRDANALRFAGDGLCLSDVLLFRDDAPPSDDASAVERGGQRMRPNVERQFADGERLRAYVEVYNLTLATHGGTRTSSYDLRYAIYPARAESDPAWVDWGRRAAEWAGFRESDAVISQTFQREGGTHDDRETIAIDIDVLDAGRYELVVEVGDRRSERRAIAHVPFWRRGARWPRESRGEGGG